MSNIGIFIGRFQPLHNGHIEIINKMIQEVKYPVIIIGSASGPRTPLNPFTFKDPITDKTKKSKKGQIKVISANGEFITILSSEDEHFDSHFNLLIPIYRFAPGRDKVPFMAVQEWSDIQARVDSFVFG